MKNEQENEIEYEQNPGYTQEELFRDLEILRKNLVGKLKENDPDYTPYPLLFLRFVQMKAKIYGLDKVMSQNTENLQMKRNRKVNENSLFNKIKERAHVFEKIRPNNA